MLTKNNIVWSNACVFLRAYVECEYHLEYNRWLIGELDSSIWFFFFFSLVTLHAVNEYAGTSPTNT